MKEVCLRNLNTNMKSELIKLGIDWQLAVGEDFDRVDWRAAPFYKAGKLFDVDLKDLLHVGLSISFEEYLDVYESYLAPEGKRKHKTQKDLRLALGLSMIGSDLLFPLGVTGYDPALIKADGTFKICQRLAPALAVLAYYNYGGEVESACYDSLVVKVNGLRLGQHLGKVLSTNPETETMHYPLYSMPHVLLGRRSFLAKSWLGYSKLGDRFSAVFRLLESSGLTQEVLSEFELGFTILLQNERNAEWLRNSWLVTGRSFIISDRHLQEALDTAKTMATFYNPREALREHLVPMVLNKKKFSALIGPKIKDADTALAAVLGLEQQLKSERRNLCL